MFNNLKTARRYVQYILVRYNERCVIVDGPDGKFAVVTPEFARENEFEIIG